MEYIGLSKELQEKIKQNTKDRYLLGCNAIRRNPNRDTATLWRPEYVRDAEKIMHSPFYNRYSDKTQVFSLYKNDDISRRSLHVQLVSRIARNIGRLLDLNLDLIEAIALGHDMGHTPFGHTGEAILNQIYTSQTGRFFLHNVHSVRVLDKIFNFNISLQTLDGILCHNGEFELCEYHPKKLVSFDEFDKIVESCYTDKNASDSLIPSTLEGCVVRISDIIAYIGKDRQDAIRTKTITSEDMFSENKIGNFNAAIINNLVVNIIENSYGKDYIKLDEEYFEALKKSKRDNYKYIYGNSSIYKMLSPMFEKVYFSLLNDLKNKNKSSLIFRHHIDYISRANRFYEKNNYAETEPNQITVDYISSMTDDYFIDLYDYLFPGSNNLKYVSYFD